MLPNWTGCVHCSDRNKVSIPQLVDEETPVDHHFFYVLSGLQTDIVIAKKHP